MKPEPFAPFTWPHVGRQWPQYNIWSPQAAGLVAWWPMIGSFGQSYVQEFLGFTNGTLTNGPVWQVDKDLGPCLQFDGDNDYLELGTIATTSPLQLANEQLTIAVWCYVNDGGDSWQRIIDKSDGGNGQNGWSFFVQPKDADGDVYNIHFNSNAATPSPIATNANMLPVNQWIHLVVTGTGAAGGGAVYVNGRAVSLLRNNSYSIPSAAVSARIGSWNHSTGREFGGYIADIRVLNHALSPAEVYTLYDPATRWELYQPLVPRFAVWFGVVGPATVFGTATLTGAGSLSAIGNQVFYVASTLTGAGSLSAVGYRITTGIAALSGTGALTAIGYKITAGIAALSGTGSLTASGTRITYGVAALTGAGALSAAGYKITAGGAALTGAGSLSAVATRLTYSAVTLTGTGTLSAIGTVVGGGIVYGVTALTGTGNLTAAPNLIMFVIAALAGAGSLSASGTIIGVSVSGETAIYITFRDKRAYIEFRDKRTYIEFRDKRIVV